MRSRMRLLGHPVHPMLVIVPSAIFPLLLLLDAGRWLRPDLVAWEFGLWLAVAGVVATLAAMVPGLVDLAAIPDGSKAHRTALVHLVVGVLVLAAYVAAAWSRWPAGVERFALSAGIDVAGTLLITAQGWLGGELVYKHHMGVLGAAEGGDPVRADEAQGAARGPGAGAVGDVPRRR